MLDPSSVTFDSGLLIEKQSANDCLEAHIIPILCDKHREYVKDGLKGSVTTPITDNKIIAPIMYK